MIFPLIASCVTSPVERRKPLKIVARLPPRLRAQRRVEIAGAIELHLRQQHGLAAPHRKRIGQATGLMQDQRADAGELPQQRRRGGIRNRN